MLIKDVPVGTLVGFRVTEQDPLNIGIIVKAFYDQYIDVFWLHDQRIVPGFVGKPSNQEWDLVWEIIALPEQSRN